MLAKRKSAHEELSRASLEEASIDDALLEDRLHAAREHFGTALPTPTRINTA